MVPWILQRYEIARVEYGDGEVQNGSKQWSDCYHSVVTVSIGVIAIPREIPIKANGNKVYQIYDFG